jgi:hypothetical protein
VFADQPATCGCEGSNQAAVAVRSGGRRIAITDEALTAILTRLKLMAIRDQLTNLLVEASRRNLTLLDTIQFLCEAELPRKEDRRIQMGLSITKFPCVATLDTCSTSTPSPRWIRVKSGSWKTYLAIAIQRDYTVLSRQVHGPDAHAPPSQVRRPQQSASHSVRP